MKYNPKFITAFVIQGNYGQGWEDETEESTYKEAKAQLKCYRENSPYPSRLVLRRVPNPDYVPGAITKKQAEERFKEYVLPVLDRSDKPLLRLEWGIFTDSLCKNAEISIGQYENWSYPSFIPA